MQCPLTAKLEENAEQADSSFLCIRKEFELISLFSLALYKSKAFLSKLSTELENNFDFFPDLPK